MNRLILLVLLFVPTIVPAQNFAPFRARYLGSTVHTINQTLTASDTITLTNYGTIYSLSINATIQQPSEGSFVRIVMEDTDGHDYLVAESDRFRNDTTQVSLTAYCEETAMLAGVTPAYLKCYLTNASISIQFLTAALSQANQAPGTTSPNELKRQQVQNIVDRINAYNRRHQKLWIADVTSLSLARYEDRGEYGKMDDVYSSNMIYYVDGIYEIGEPSSGWTQGLSLYPDSFSWTNRHGKNWMTIPKNQGSSSWCVPFAVASTVEAMVNLYYNRHIDMDLSEADIAFNNNRQPYKKGSIESLCMNVVKRDGVIDETSFPFVSDTLYQHPSTRPIGLEMVKISNYTYCSHQIQQGYDKYDNIKGALIERGPAASGFYLPKGSHSMCLTGYGKVTPGIAYSILSPWNNDSIICEGNNYIGRTYWEFKDSYYESPSPDIRERYFGHEGYMYIIFHEGSYGMRTPYFATTPITTLSYSEIVIEDLDGDGYFNWGIGPRPVHCPAWAPNEPDGDDSDFTKGPMNEYGYCMELDSLSKHYIYIDNDTILAMNSPIYNHYVIWNGAEVTITQDLTFSNDTKLIVDKNSTLIIDGATLSNVTLLAQQGSNIVMKNNGKIIHRQTKDFVIPLGSTFELKYGSVQ